MAVTWRRLAYYDEIGSGGHIIIDQDGIPMTPRSNLQFTDGLTVTDDEDSTTIVKLSAGFIFGIDIEGNITTFEIISVTESGLFCVNSDGSVSPVTETRTDTIFELDDNDDLIPLEAA